MEALIFLFSLPLLPLSPHITPAPLLVLPIFQVGQSPNPVREQIYNYDVGANKLGNAYRKPRQEKKEPTSTLGSRKKEGLKGGGRGKEGGKDGIVVNLSIIVLPCLSLFFFFFFLLSMYTDK